jgi:hypothetical protein
LEEIAVDGLLTDPKARTGSRISLLTGVHRNDIRRQRAIPVDPQEAPGVVAQVSRIIVRGIGGTGIGGERLAWAAVTRDPAATSGEPATAAAGTSPLPAPDPMVKSAGSSS